MPYDHGLVVLPLDAAELRDVLYSAVAGAVTPAALRARTVDIVAYPPRSLLDERSIHLLVLVSVQDKPLPNHLDRERILAAIEVAGIKPEATLNNDTIWGQIGDIRFWIVIHKVPHSRGFSDVLVPAAA
jgi:hypothetical protein